MGLIGGRRGCTKTEIKRQKMERVVFRIWRRIPRARIGTTASFGISPRILLSARPAPFQTTFQATISRRLYSSPAAQPQLQSQAPLEPPADLDEKERAVFEQLVAGLQPAQLAVRDVSGGCGSMYAIEVASERFRGMGMLAQQKMVNKLLEKEIEGWHGVQLKTRVP